MVPCNTHLSAVGELSEEIQYLNYQVIAINPDSPAKIRESIEEQKLDYTLFSDAYGKLIQAMACLQIPGKVWKYVTKFFSRE